MQRALCSGMTVFGNMTCDIYDKETKGVYVQHRNCHMTFSCCSKALELPTDPTDMSSPCKAWHCGSVHVDDRCVSSNIL